MKDECENLIEFTDMINYKNPAIEFFRAISFYRKQKFNSKFKII